MPLPSGRTRTQEIPEKGTASAKRCKMDQEGKSEREREREQELREEEDTRTGDNRTGHGGWSMYFKPQIVTENCLVFKSHRLFASRIPFFASVALRENGNAD